MLHVGTLHQPAEVEARPGRRGEVGRGLGGEVGVDEWREVGLVGEQSRPRGGRAPSQRVTLLFQQAVAHQGVVAGLRAQTVRLGGAAHGIPAVTLLPAAAAAAPSEPGGETERLSHRN